MVDSNWAKKWLEKAESDFGFAASILPDTTFYAQVCFHFQQAAEKFLKAYIVRYDLEFKKIHDLVQLLEICVKHNESFASLIDDCRSLTTLYFDTRYPVHWPSAVSKEEATKALEAARKIKVFIENLLLK